MTIESDILIEQVVSARRERDPRGAITPSSAFFDLDQQGRATSFSEAMKQRAIEAARDPQGRSTTVLAVLRIIKGG